LKRINVASWEEFHKQIEELLKFSFQERQALYISETLFRGQANTEWPLTTTLERYLKKDTIKMLDYYHTIFAAKHRIESFTGKEWKIPGRDEYELWLQKYDPFNIGEFKAYDYMVYLRHDGFPSPLLDWTTSPYVAAYFAFRDISNAAEAVAIFAYIEYFGQGKSRTGNEPYIFGLGPYISSHKRHFLQQCQYTICSKKEDDIPYYTNHEKVFSKNDQGQDLLWKIIIPADMNRTFLKHLDFLNINAYSLFGSDESLMETVALRELILRRKI
jgi:hypothetical protein